MSRITGEYAQEVNVMPLVYQYPHTPISMSNFRQILTFVEGAVKRTK